MSGSAALSAARRRRGGGGGGIEQNVNIVQGLPQPEDKKVISSFEIIKHHHNEIIDIKKKIEKISGSDSEPGGSVDDIRKELLDVKKTLLKLQTFIIDIDKELKKIKSNNTKSAVNLNEND